MSRKEAVVLVSRALAVIQFITALLDISVLPERFISLHHYAHIFNSIGASETTTYYLTYDRVEIAFLFARIACLLTLTLVLWNCGPWVERLLLPKIEEQQQPD
jgi:hypothetical protein